MMYNIGTKLRKGHQPEGVKMFSLSYINLEKDEVEIKNGFKSDKEAYDYIANHKEVLPLKLLIWSEARQCNREIETFVKY